MPIYALEWLTILHVDKFRLRSLEATIREPKITSAALNAVLRQYNHFLWEPVKINLL